MKLTEYQRLAGEGRIQNRNLRRLELAGTGLVIAGSVAMLVVLFLGPNASALGKLALVLTLSAVGVFSLFLWKVSRLRPPS